LQEHDPILALGVTPVAVRYWYGDRDEVIRPWARAAAGNADPAVLDMPFDDVDVEAVAALRPDLILGVHSGVTERDYRRLSRVAPTVAQPGE
jgi:iron complex transport system substrate-binding protein